MFPDLPNGDADEQSKTAPQGIQQIPLLPFAVQLQNIFPVEITAKRFPIDKVIDMASVVSTAHTHLNLSDLSVDTESLLAQIHLEVSVRFPQEPRLFTSDIWNPQ